MSYYAFNDDNFCPFNLALPNWNLKHVCASAHQHFPNDKDIEFIWIQVRLGWIKILAIARPATLVPTIHFKSSQVRLGSLLNFGHRGGSTYL